MIIKGGMVALVAIQYENELIPKNLETLDAIQTEILSEQHWNDASSKSYLSKLEECAKVIKLRDTLFELAGSLDPEMSISWEFMAKCLKAKGFDNDLIKVVYTFFESKVSMYEEFVETMKDMLTFDSEYNVYVYPLNGACIGNVEIKNNTKDDWNDVLAKDDYYASLIEAGCELTLGHNLTDPFNVSKMGVYCSNYQEMFDAGILGQENTTQDTFGEAKK